MTTRLADLVVDALLFLETTGDDNLDQDSAVQMEEQLAALLGDATPGESATVADAIRRRAEAAESGERLGRADILGIGEAFGVSVDEAAQDTVDLKAFDFLCRAIVEFVLFLELTPEERLNPDNAAEAEEELVAAVAELPDTEREALTRVLKEVAASEGDEAETSRADALAILSSGLGLEQEVPTRVPEARWTQRRGPALVDRKIAVPLTPLMVRQARRQSSALRQHGYRGRWEVPTSRDAVRAERVLADAGVDNIDILIVPRGLPSA